MTVTCENKNTHCHVINFMSNAMLFNVLVSLKAYDTAGKLRHMVDWTFWKLVVMLGDSFFFSRNQHMFGNDYGKCRHPTDLCLCLCLCVYVII